MKLKFIPDDLKPDRMLENIAKRFGFESGIPEHDIGDKYMHTKAEFHYKHESHDAWAKISETKLEGFDAVLCEYVGPVLVDGLVELVGYSATVLEGTSCKGQSARRVIRRHGTPDWFPV